MSVWIQALKIWNKGEIEEGRVASWLIPRKGTDAYDEVRGIMDYLRAHPNFFKGAEDVEEQIEKVGPATASLMAKKGKKAAKKAARKLRDRV
jgi:hypothetical protein